MNAIVQMAFKGYATVASSLAPDSATEFAAVGPTQYDPEGAKAPHRRLRLRHQHPHHPSDL